MLKIVFRHSKKDLLEAFKIYSEFTGVKSNLESFHQNWEVIPKSVIGGFIRRWRKKEAEVLRLVSERYYPWGSGEIVVWLFPNKKVLSSLPKPYSEITYTFKGVDKPCVSLFFVDKKIPYWLLIHELFHANDVLRGQHGQAVSSEKHKWLDEISKKIERSVF